MLVLTTFDMPAATSTIASMTDYGGGFFTEYAITIIGTILGLVVAALAINWIKRSGNKFLKTIFGGRKKRYRR